PRTLADLGKSRLLLREARKGAIAEGLVEAVQRGLDMPQSAWPKLPKGKDRADLNAALADLLRVLLKAKAEEAGVAAKLIASSSDLDDIASGEREGIWATGWRREVFGEDALKLLDGKIALAAEGDRVKAVPV
ncbi:MAG: ribonuclease D, partial [Roseicyclus sp.]